MQVIKYILPAILLFSSPSYSEECTLDEYVRRLKSDLRDQYRDRLSNDEATEMARTLAGTDLEKHTYMAKWKLARDNQRGPWAKEGNTLVVGLEESQFASWQEKIGKKSFGIGMIDLPDEVEGGTTAYLRVGDKVVGYDDIHGTPYADRDVHFEDLWDDLTRTEATFMATEEELQQILKFIDDRTEGRIVAQRRMSSRRGGRSTVIERGDVLNPDFDIPGANLFREGCGGACGSPFNPRWLAQYDAPNALKMAQLAHDKAVYTYANPKAYVYSNFRNPNAASITLFGLKQNRWGNPIENLGEDFMGNNDWNGARGMMWGFIPDKPPRKRTNTYTSERIPIAEWLRGR